MLDPRGVPVSTESAACVEGLETAHWDVLAFVGDPVAKIDAVLADHPDFIMGHLFKAGVLTQAMETRIYDDMVGALEAAEAMEDRANDREKGHMKAVRAWVEGDFSKACELWDAVLIDHPRDLLALQLAHLSDVLLGDTVNQRNRVARVMAAYDESVPGYNWVLGFYAFGLEENGDYHHAEEMARRALALEPRDPYSIHAVAHVMEMMGRQTGGIAFMNGRRGDWADTNFRNHLWWHLSLMHLDIGETSKVLEIYDGHLRDLGPDGDEKYQELDASALLWRLNLYGVDVGDRWSEIADRWEPSATDRLYAFNDVHAMMTFVADGRWDAAEAVVGANERHVQRGRDENVAMTREVGLPFCLALKAFAEGRYGEAVDRLHPIQHRTARLGGSHAQRDVIALTLIEAALRAGRYPLARALMRERCALKPSSPQNWKLLSRALQGCGEMDAARTARSRAASLFSHLADEDSRH